MASIYYIDGYNVIHHSTMLKPLASENFEAARDALIEKVARFCIATGHQAKIIFDGRGRHRTQAATVPHAPGLEVLYSPANKSADALIERMVYAASDRRSIIVVSADRGIRSLCRGMSALVMDPDNFLSSVSESEDNTRSTLKTIQRPDELQRIENRLGASNVARLQKLKEKLPARAKPGPKCL